MKDLPSFLILVKLCSVNCEDQLDNINKKVDEDSGRGGAEDNGRFRNRWRFSRN